MFPIEEEGCIAHLSKPEDITFCPAIQQLYDEHPALREQMHRLLEKASILDEAVANVPEYLQELSELESVFKKELDIHSEKEENGLFPMVGKYIGTKAGPVAVMEYEHSEAKRNLNDFEQRATSGLKKENPSLETVKQITEPLTEACHILLNHFMKEENVLFPMAEQLLNGQEKEDLLQIVKPTASI